MTSGKIAKDTNISRLNHGIKCEYDDCTYLGYVISRILKYFKNFFLAAWSPGP